MNEPSVPVPAEPLAPRHPQRGRWILLGLLAALLTGFAALSTVLRPYGHGNSAVDIELARDVEGFANALASGWRHAGTTTCGIGEPQDSKAASFNRLRCHLFVDSVLFAPAYVGLLTFFTLLLSTVCGVARVELRHLACLPAIAAGLFDIAENGMTVVATEELLRRLLSDATVQDVRLASLFKWWLVAAAFAEVGALALLARRRLAAPAARRLLLAGGLLACAGALALAYALLAMEPVRPEWGMLLGVVAALSLAWWRLRHHAPALNQTIN